MKRLLLATAAFVAAEPVRRGTLVLACYTFGALVACALATLWAIYIRSAWILLVPIVFPIVTQVGFDPIWFGVIIVLVAEMGVITPPVGINVYVVFGVARRVIGEVPLESIFKGIFPFLAVLILLIALLVAFPQIVLFLPGLVS